MTSIVFKTSERHMFLPKKPIDGWKLAPKVKFTLPGPGQVIDIEEKREERKKLQKKNNSHTFVW